MIEPTTIAVRPAPGRYLVVQVALFAVLLLLLAVLARRVASDREERAQVMIHDLGQAVTSSIGEFRRDRIVHQRVRALVAACRRPGGRPTGVAGADSPSRRLAALIGRQFPGASLFVFDRAGRVVQQSANEPRRPREIVWRAVLDLWRQPGEDLKSAPFQTATKMCHTMYGSLVELPDLVPGDGSPRSIQAKGAMRFSLILPARLLASMRAEGIDSNGESLEGIWVILDPRRIDTKPVERRVLRGLAPLVDGALIVERNQGRPRIVRGCGAMRPAAGGPRRELATFAVAVPALGIAGRTLARFFRGQIEWTDGNATWVGRYIPDERGRYLLAGVRPERFRGALDRIAPVLRGVLWLAFVAGSWLAFSGFALGRPPLWKLAPLVFALFAFTTVVPLVFVVVQGLDLAREKGRQARVDWERRLRARLATVDRQHLEFQRRRIAALAPIEAQLATAVPLGTAGASLLRGACSGLDQFGVVVHDESGRLSHWRRNLENMLNQGDYPNLQARYLARLIAAEGRVPVRELAESSLMLDGYPLEAVINRLFQERSAFNRLRVRGRSLWVRQTPLVREGPDGPQTVGIVSWVFEEFSFSLPFVTEALAWFARPENRVGNAEFGFVRRDGEAWPAGLARSAELRRMAERVDLFHAPETGVVRFADGRTFLAVVTFPAQVSGFCPVGLVEIPPTGSPEWADVPRVLGLAPVLPSDDGRIFVLRVLLFSVVAGLLMMVPIAVFLSKWLVGRIAGLQAMVGRVAANDLTARAEVQADDELGHLAGSLNDMARGLQEREQMARFLSDEVIREVRKDDRESLALGGQCREVAIVFTHIHHFDDLVARESPAVMIDLLNDYFTFVDACIRKARGSIDKLIGDAVLAVFFDEPGGTHPAQRALAAARAIRAHEEAFNETRRGAGRFTVRTDVGLHFGPVISGKVGSRRGMIDFTVIGDTVNAAARIQAQAAREAAPAILLSRDVLGHLGPGLPVEPLPPVALKGKAVPLALFRLT